MEWFDLAQVIGLFFLGLVQLYEFIVVYKIHKNQQDFKKEGDNKKWLK
jgi:hypothetical protein